MAKYTVYSADRSGNSWDVASYDGPLSALTRLEWERQDWPDRAHGVYDPDNPERGDCQMELEEMLEDL